MYFAAAFCTGKAHFHSSCSFFNDVRDRICRPWLASALSRSAELRASLARKTLSQSVAGLYLHGLAFVLILQLPRRALDLKSARRNTANHNKDAERLDHVDGHRLFFSGTIKLQFPPLLLRYSVTAARHEITQCSLIVPEEKSPNMADCCSPKFGKYYRLPLDGQPGRARYS